MAMLPLHINLDLSPGAWVLTIGAAAIFAYVVSSIIAWRRLRQFKGPFLGSFSYLWIIRASLSGRMGEYWNDAAVQYGSGPSSTVRIGPNELLTSDPDMIRRTSAARSKYTRSAWYKLNRADPYRDSMINMLDTAQHDKAKAQMAPGYAGKDNPGLEGDIDAILAQMTDKIRTKYAVEESGGDKKPKLDLATMAQYFTLDSISKVAFGDEFGMIHAERDIHDHIAVLNQVTPSVGTIASVPYFRAIMGSDFVMKLIGPKVGDKRGIGRMMAWVLPPLCWIRVTLTETP
jgi:cytochrome P450